MCSNYLQELNKNRDATPRVRRVQITNDRKDGFIYIHCGLHLSKPVDDRLECLQNFWLGEFTQESDQLWDAFLNLPPVFRRMRSNESVPNSKACRCCAKVSLL